MITSKPLFIFEIANNHMGDVEHGLKIIEKFDKILNDFKTNFTFAFKLQYRNLDTFIHPEYRSRTDIKYVKRFSETRLTGDEFLTLRNKIKSTGNLTVCTPFDETSVNLIEEHDFDIIKIASCSMTDWPLLEKISLVDKPIIVSTAGSSIEDIDKVVSFFKHREKEFTVMHCVGEYPTQVKNLNLNQISYLKNRYIDIPIGYSTHEAPDNFEAIKLAVAKGAIAFERHIGLKTEKYDINAYSSIPEQIEKWLTSAKVAYEMCGVINQRYTPSDKEINDLRGLKRGVFAKNDISKGQKLTIENIYFAIPNSDGQILANDFSKYIDYTALNDLKSNSKISFTDVSPVDKRKKVVEIVNKIKDILIDSKIYLPNRLDVELSHHYGLDKFFSTGASLINCINREYCKKLIILFPGQENPVHHHIKKEETFHVLYGDIIIDINGVQKEYKAGEMIVIERNMKHSFSSKNGCVFEEVSTTHFKEDSFYEDSKINGSNSRKTSLTFWSDWLTDEIV